VIEKGAFEDCQGLMMADLDKGLEIIGARVFQHCISLHHIDIPHGVGSIQKWAFAYCSRLTTLVINNSLVVIEKLHLPIAFYSNASWYPLPLQRLKMGHSWNALS
jgi:hypothetical protein